MRLVWFEKECLHGFDCELIVLLCVCGVLSIASPGFVVGWVDMARVERAAFLEGRGSI
jgi:hypothetical protein